MRLSAGPNYEVVFQVFLAAIVHEVHILVDRWVTHSPEKGNIGAPFTGIAADEIIPLREQRFLGQRHDPPPRRPAPRGAGNISALSRSEVRFRDITPQEIEEYVATGEADDKAGAYGIQGFGATIVRRVDGDYFAVMGLPLQLLVRVLGRMGLSYVFGPVELA